ncbi:unnamed protein product, partial [Closterium sp. NIES-54]
LPSLAFNASQLRAMPGGQAGALIPSNPSMGPGQFASLCSSDGDNWDDVKTKVCFKRGRATHANATDPDATDSSSGDESCGTHWVKTARVKTEPEVIPSLAIPSLP